jgi:hypothetical protein
MCNESFEAIVDEIADNDFFGVSIDDFAAKIV